MKFHSLFVLAVISIFILSSCQQNQKVEEEVVKEPVQSKKALWAKLTNNFDNHQLKVPEGAVVDVLFTEKIDSVKREDGKKFPAKGKHDYVEYVPINGSSTEGMIFVNHEWKYADANLGDGGGMSWFNVSKKSGKWTVDGDYHHIDFSGVGGSFHNCGGTTTPHGTILTAEEYPPSSNMLMYENNWTKDTSDVNGLKRYENLGWMVEIDIESKKVLRKLYSMGRYSHEDAACLADGKTVFLTDDFNPAILYKFVADNAGAYSEGQLYAFQETDNNGNWLPLPREREKLVHARDEAIKLGATLFVRHEWIQEVNGKIYIAETGSDEFDWSIPMSKGGKPASYYMEAPYNKGNGIFDDPYGRILELDPNTNQLRIYLEAGDIPGDDGANFSNPDGMSVATIANKKYLVMCEDIIAHSRNRVSSEAEAREETYNEIYFLDLSIKNPQKTDLIRFSVGPRGCEQTGPVFTPDYKTMFFSIQGPSSENPEPFNLTSVVAVSGVF